MERLIILGAGQQGRNCKRLAPLNNYEAIGFVDDYIQGEIESLPVYRTIEEIPDYRNCKYIVAVGDMEVRKVFVEKIRDLQLDCANLIDPTASIEDGAIIGKGNYIYKFVSVYASATIGDHNIINSKAVLATDAVVGNNCNICMGSNLCGDVHVGDNSYIGYNATVVSGNNVGRDAVVEAGAVVMSEVPDGAYVYGIPAKVAERIGGCKHG